MKKLSKQYAAKKLPSAPQEKITKKSAIELLAPLDQAARGTSLRAAKQRLRTYIDKAVTKGELTQEMWHGKKSFVSGRFAAWMEDNLQELFDKLPHKPPVIRDQIFEVTGVQGTSIVGLVASTSIPATLLECQEQLREAQQRISELEYALRKRRKVG